MNGKKPKKRVTKGFKKGSPSKTRKGEKDFTTKKAEKLVNDYMQFCNNNYYDAQKSALFATELMIEVCNTCLLYTKQPIRENDDIYNNLVKVKNELKKLKPISEIAKEKQSERFMESVRNSGVFEKIMEGKMCAIHNEALNEDGLCNTCLENSNK